MNQKEQAKDMADKFTTFVNNYNHDADAFIDAYCNEHRTLQQSGFRLMLKLIERFASDEYRFDDRNHAVHQTSKLLLDGFKEVIMKQELDRGATIPEAKNYIESEYCKPYKFLPHI